MTAPSTAGSHLQRVPPHDIAVEANLLGAAMLAPDAARVVATFGLDLYYGTNQRHQTIAEAITWLVDHGSPTDPVSVHAEIRRRGQAEILGNPAYLTELQANTTSTTSAAHWADLLATFARRRHILHLAEGTIQAVYSGTGHVGLVTQMAEAVADEAAHQTSTWEPVDLAGSLEEPSEPTIGRREDGSCLLYPGKLHAFNGEPEAAKSLCAQWIAAQEILAGHHVLYIDFEDSARGIIRRLVELGLQLDHILERFHYIRPEEGVDAAARVRIEAAVAAWPITFCVIDGVAEVMALSGLEENSNGDVAAFYARLPRIIASRGPAVVLIDHVVKDSDNQGRYARGAGHKLAGIDGAVFKIEAVKPFYRGSSGWSRLVLQKDRPARLREICTGKTAAEFHVTSSADGQMVASLKGQAGGEKGDPNWRPTTLMEKVSRAVEDHPGMSKRMLRTVVQGKNDYIDQAIEFLILDGFMDTARDHQTTVHTILVPYRAPEEPVAAGYGTDVPAEDWDRPDDQPNYN